MRLLRRFAIPVVVLVLAMALVACEGSVSPTPPLSTEPAPTSVATPPALPDTPTAVVPTTTPVAEATPTSFPAATPTYVPPIVEWTGPMNRIVYQAADGAIYTVRPDGTDRRRVSGTPGAQVDAINVWPVWSPDSGTIVFSAITSVLGQSAEFSLRRGGALGGYEPVILHVDGSTSNGINPGTPHYALWSPDGERVALITDAGQGIVTFNMDAETGLNLRGHYQGAPVYVSWAADSEHMLVHVNEYLFMWTTDTATGRSTSTKIGSGSISYRAPQWNPVDSSYLYVDVVDSRRELLLGALGQDAPQPVKSLDSAVEFTWSPDGTKIALFSGSGEYFDSLEVIDAAGESAGPRLEALVQAAWWSPDSRRLLVAAGDSAEPGVIVWRVINVESGDDVEVARTVPSGPLYLMLTFHSQYAASHQLWSPESESVVIVGALLGDDGDAGREYVDSGAEVSRIWVVDADGELPPVAVGDGLLAAWSPT